MSRFSVAIMSLLLFLSILCGDCLGASGSVRVRGYTRKDGTYVAPHYRSAPDGNFGNNWSTKGNVNPYTGEPGYKTSPSGIGYGSDRLPTVGTGSNPGNLTPNDSIQGIREAALNGNPMAQNSLGVLYWKGDVVRLDYKESVKWFRKAMENGNSMGAVNLGRAYLLGNGVAQDFCRGYKLISKAAEDGNSSAIEICAKYRTKLDERVLAALSRFESFEELQKSANSGDADAESLLGQFYIEGTNGLKKNSKDAMKWTLTAANKGNPLALMNMGWIYENGFGVSSNILTSLQWYSKAADQNFIPSFAAIGHLYRNESEGLTNHQSQAVHWFRKAAEAGNAEGQLNLGDCYYNGEGLVKDYKTALEWYLKAAEQGHAGAQCSVGYQYHVGEGVEKNYTEAVRWYQLSAEQGDTTAQNNLGECYRDGEGVLQNYVEAYKWFNLSASKGDEDAAKSRNDLLQLMTKEQVAEGQKR